MSQYGRHPPVVIVAAVSETGVIGRDNQLPWRLSTDLKRFKALTLGKPMIMGRRTWLSIGRPLPGRRTIVVSRDLHFVASGAIVATTLTDAFVLARDAALEMGADEIAVVGGAQVYAAAMHDADRLEITEVHCQMEGDAVFPQIRPSMWRETARTEVPAGEKDDHAMTFVTYQRRLPGDRDRP
ncbi:dihydrofolate reductase [Amorphus sp. MBR-141]